MNRLILLIVLIVIAIAPANSQEPDTVWTKNFMPQKVYDAKFSPDGTIIAHGLGTMLQLRNTSDGELIKELHSHPNEEVRTVAFSPDGQFVFAGGGRDPLESNVPYVKMWNVETGELVRTFYTDEGIDRTSVTSIDISKDGRYLAAVIDSKKMVDGSRDLALFIWDINMNGMPQIKKLCSGEHPAVVKFSPDGSNLAVATSININLYDSNEFTFISKLGDIDDKHYGRIQDLSFSPDGSRIATVAEDGLAKIWDVENRSLEKSIKVDIIFGDLRSICFNSTGEYFVAGGGFDIETQIWDVIKEIKTYSYGILKGSVFGVDVFWGNDQIISSSGYSLILYNGRFNTSLVGDNPDNPDNLFPNPTNNLVTIRFDLPTNSTTIMSLSDINGVDLDLIFEGFLESGFQEILYNASHLAQGIYFINIQSPSFSKTLKLIRQ